MFLITRQGFRNGQLFDLCGPSCFPHVSKLLSCSFRFQCTFCIVLSKKYMFAYGLYTSCCCYWMDSGFSLSGPNFPCLSAAMLALRLNYFATALIIHEKVSSNCKLVELKILDFSDRTKTGISILTLATDNLVQGQVCVFFSFYTIALWPILSWEWNLITFTGSFPLIQ